MITLCEEQTETSLFIENISLGQYSQNSLITYLKICHVKMHCTRFDVNDSECHWLLYFMIDRVLARLNIQKCEWYFKAIGKMRYRRFERCLFFNSIIFIYLFSINNEPHVFMELVRYYGLECCWVKVKKKVP